MESITDHEDYGDWGVYSGRISCFDNCLAHLSKIYPL
jgi:WD40 repeat protein